jgi:formylmethanofuran dehydrogenase subunit E
VNRPLLAPFILSMACASAAAPEHHHHGHAVSPPAGDQEALAAVAAIHGGAGPWAVAGYRMGRFALTRLGLTRGSFDVEVVHATPREVQYACIADGAAAATGASPGKLNLALEDSSAEATHTTYRRRSTGQTVVLRVTGAFKARFTNVPRERLGDAGREVLGLRDDEIFEVVP